jgi:AcrR family transcriptional regulator
VTTTASESTTPIAAESCAVVEEQAAETRRLIVDAARRLFASRGYAATSIAAIAAEAGVAVPTIYASVGTKLRLLELLNARIDDETRVSELAPRLMARQDPRELLELQTRLSRTLNERAGDLVAALRSAATAEPEMAAPYAEGIERHRGGMRATAGRLHELGALRAGMTPEQAAALLDVHLAPEAWTTLTTGHGFGWDEAEALTSRGLARLLLAPGARRART